MPPEDKISTVKPSSIKECEERYPEMTREFKKIMNEEYEMFCKKSLDYGVDNISVPSPTPDQIRFSLMGLFFRMNDKINRVKQLVVLGSENRVGEQVQDTYQDLSIYGIICQVVSRGKWGK
jgi:hypothetical protein